MKTTGNTILITGGGSGIGRELALRFNDLGNTVIVAGRRKEALQETIADRKGMHAMASTSKIGRRSRRSPGAWSTSTRR